jgi:hypothetical protein
MISLQFEEFQPKTMRKKPKKKVIMKNGHVVSFFHGEMT